MSGGLAVGLIVAAFAGAMIFAGVSEHYEQKANRAACSGRYIKVGERRDSGLCIRPDAIIWEKR